MYIPAALFAYQSIKQATTKYLPLFILYGYEPKIPFDLDHYVHEKNSPKFEAILRHRTTNQMHSLNKSRKQAHKSINQTQATQKEDDKKKRSFSMNERN